MEPKQDAVRQILGFFDRSCPSIPFAKGTVFKPPTVIRTWGKEGLTARMEYKASHFATIRLYLPGLPEPLTLRLAGVDIAEANREFEKLKGLLSKRL